MEERHLEEKFVNAPAIFPNNDIKFDVSKTRAQIFAESVNEAITWSIARDAPINKVIGYSRKAELRIRKESVADKARRSEPAAPSQFHRHGHESC